jgi:FMN phosphatase YigB (HAD superfamily)
MKKDFYIDFDDVVDNYKDGKRMRDFFKKLSENYKIYIFTTKDSVNTYRWLIRHHLSDYIEDVTNTKPRRFYLYKKYGNI